jgi:hypothetical protein
MQLLLSNCVVHAESCMTVVCCVVHAESCMSVVCCATAHEATSMTQAPVQLCLR